MAHAQPCAAARQLTVGEQLEPGGSLQPDAPGMPRLRMVVAGHDEVRVFVLALRPSHVLPLWLPGLGTGEVHAARGRRESRVDDDHRAVRADREGIAVVVGKRLAVGIGDALDLYIVEVEYKLTLIAWQCTPLDDRAAGEPLLDWMHPDRDRDVLDTA